jgi:UDP-N-acetylglucosamine 4,6-dehydratase
MKGNIFITGGGTLAKAIITRSKQERDDCSFTVVSRDPIKQIQLTNLFPDIRYSLCDIRDTARLSDLMVGHDTVIHTAAMKHIPLGETNVLETIEINLEGSLSVATAAIKSGIKSVMGISTDKVCHAVNTYGATKYLMEKMFQEFAWQYETEFHLVRYGNVLASNGSVIQVWRKMLAETGKVTATDPDMTRYWLTADQAVSLIRFSFNQPSGTIIIPNLPALKMSDMAKYTLPEGTEITYSGLRPGEKRHEEMLTEEEGYYAETTKGFDGGDEYIRLWPTSEKPFAYPYPPMTSDKPEHWITETELAEMLA